MTDATTRRDALRRITAAGLAVGSVAGLAAWLRHTPGWPPPDARVTLPSYEVERDGPTLVVARGPQPAPLVEAALEEMGGIAAFIERGDRVLIKPNAAFDRPAWQGTTTNPDVVHAVVRACIGAGAAEVVVTDNPIHAPEGCFRKTGIGHAVESAGGRVLLPQPSAFANVALEDRVLDGWPVYVRPLLAATKLIGIAPAKDHNLARASMTMKNWYGLLGGPRNRLHQRMDDTIATLVELFRPTLSILDGTRVLIRNGPTGGSPEDVIAGDLIAMSTDPVALDTFGATLLGLEAKDLPYLALAESRGAGLTVIDAAARREITR